jgi:hypothetical protein
MRTSGRVWSSSRGHHHAVSAHSHASKSGGEVARLVKGDDSHIVVTGGRGKFDAAGVDAIPCPLVTMSAVIKQLNGVGLNEIAKSD